VVIGRLLEAAHGEFVMHMLLRQLYVRRRDDAGQMLALFAGGS
jgi:hypothetical protein